MNLYYKNETLFVDINTVLDHENMSKLKRRVFRIVDDYDIDRIVFQVLEGSSENKRMLQELKREYNQRYQGNLLIK
jgi:UTP:GlnB (protein PII) uridylyltransferase